MRLGLPVAALAAIAFLIAVFGRTSQSGPRALAQPAPTCDPFYGRGCTGLTVTPTATVNGNETPTVTATPTVPSGPPVCDPFYGRHCQTATPSPTPGATATVTPTATPVPNADLSITKTAGQTSVLPGGEITYTITATNSGSSAATNVTIMDNLPANTTFSLVTGLAPLTCTETEGDVTCAVATLAAGSSATFLYQVRAAGSLFNGGTITNTATVTGSGATDPDNTNNTATTATTVLAVPSIDLSVTKAAPATATAGQALAYTITVSNVGTQFATNVTISDQLPTGLTFVSSTQTGIGGFNCGFAQGAVTCLGSLGPGQSSTITVNTVVNAAASGTAITNTAAVSSSSEPDPNPDNDSASVTTTVR